MKYIILSVFVIIIVGSYFIYKLLDYDANIYIKNNSSSDVSEIVIYDEYHEIFKEHLNKNNNMSKHFNVSHEVNIMVTLVINKQKYLCDGGGYTMPIFFLGRTASDITITKDLQVYSQSFMNLFTSFKKRYCRKINDKITPEQSMLNFKTALINALKISDHDALQKLTLEPEKFFENDILHDDLKSFIFQNHSEKEAFKSLKQLVNQYQFNVLSDMEDSEFEESTNIYFPTKEELVFVPVKTETTQDFFSNKWMKEYFSCKVQLSNGVYKIVDHFCFAGTKGPD